MSTPHDKLEDSSRIVPEDVKSAFVANRQAIVVIHGIGNQRPMDTLRPFVDAVLDVDPACEQDPKYYSKPDDLSDTFELRRLQSRDSRPRTDYFELYWQHLVPTATWQRIGAWLALLLKRRWGDVPPSLRGLWTLTWVIAAAVAILLLLTILMWVLPGVFSAPGWLMKEATYPLGLAAVLLVVQGVVLNYVGDAAIYLSPEPRNIKARQAVRDAGVALIERLHAGLEAGRAYDRIVLVGHSLGSVIGYDILTYAWPRFNQRHGRPEHPTHNAQHGAEAAAKSLWNAAGGTDEKTLQQARDEWTRASRLLWIEQRRNRFPWLVTDFITLGSPLAHSVLLLARSRAEFERKKSQRELPTSPPQLDHGRSFSYPRNYKLDNGTPRTTRELNHAAVFAATRWTNLFFPAQFGLKGDLIGGAISDALGPGIIDVPVVTATRGGWLAHTSYWRPHKSDRHNLESAIARLTSALDIGRKSFKGLATADKANISEAAPPTLKG